MRNVCVERQVLIRQVNVVQVQFDQLIFIFCIAVRCLQSIDRGAQLYLLPAAYIVCGKVMFPVVCVCQSVHRREGSPCDRSHGTPPNHHMDIWRPPPFPRPVQTCSLWDTPPDYLFKLVHLGTFPLPGPIETCSLGDLPLDLFKLVHLGTSHAGPIQTCSLGDPLPLPFQPIGERTVGLWLKGLLVLIVVALIHEHVVRNSCIWFMDVRAYYALCPSTNKTAFQRDAYRPLADRISYIPDLPHPWTYPRPKHTNPLEVPIPLDMSLPPPRKETLYQRYT